MNQPGFYDDPANAGAYTRRRHQDPTNPIPVMEEPALRRHIGDVRGLTVLDLGCGDAAIARDLLAAGCAGYLGVDSALPMVALAGERLRPYPTAEIRHGTIEQFIAPAGSVDLIISRLAMNYVRDLAPVLRSCHTALASGGRLVFSVPHPILTCNDGNQNPGGRRTTWLVDHYFTPGPRLRAWHGSTVTWYHRTVEDQVSALLAAGFTLTALSECSPQRGLFKSNGCHDNDNRSSGGREYGRRLRVPSFLLLAGRKT